MAFFSFSKMGKKKGFTLLEVLMAMVILSTALMALSMSWTGSVRAYRKGRQIDVITQLLQRQITEMELEFQDQNISSAQEREGEFENYPEFSWKAEIKPLEFPDLAPILVGQEGGVDQMTLTVIRQMSSQLTQAIKELRVSVLWTQNDKTMTYSVTTYLVSYNLQGLGIGVGGASP